MKRPVLCRIIYTVSLLAVLHTFPAVSAEATWPSVQGAPSQGCTGIWEVQDSPNPGAFGSVLRAAWAASPADTWAVGDRRARSGFEPTLTQHWDGTSWTVYPSPNTRYRWNVLLGIAGSSSSDVWAVGRGFYNLETTLILHWNGTRWIRVKSPNPGYVSELRGVWAFSPTDAWAVGGFRNRLSPWARSLTMHWDGTSWRPVPSPNIKDRREGRNNVLTGVWGYSSSDVWAVGYATDKFDVGTPIALHWDGMAWTRVFINKPTPDTRLLGVSGSSSTDVSVVGYHSFGGPVGQKTLALHWDGTVWTKVQSADGPYGGNQLDGVSVSGPGDAWAVGEYGGPGGGTRTMVERFDGMSWTRVDSPNPGAGEDILSGVSALPSTDAWAVGNWEDEVGGKDHTLILHYCQT
jgi:hypothetical protein